mmetsp:Transcript_20127/g.46283  ORF Transcript_20127/g.46283 Transcript_20127/m.46283 type:complete len:293 (-) Transcript_20127:990-1868(-)
MADLRFVSKRTTFLCILHVAWMRVALRSLSIAKATLRANTPRQVAWILMVASYVFMKALNCLHIRHQACTRMMISRTFLKCCLAWKPRTHRVIIDAACCRWKERFSSNFSSTPCLKYMRVLPISNCFLPSAPAGGKTSATMILQASRKSSLGKLLPLGRRILKRWMNSLRGIRAGNPARHTLMASITPAQRSWSTTMALFTSDADLFLFGLMHRTYCTSVLLTVCISSAKEFLNFVTTVALPWLDLAPGAKSACSSGSLKHSARMLFPDSAKSWITSSETASLLRSSHPVAV